MVARFARHDVPTQHLVACAAKLATMMIQGREEIDAFRCLLRLQGSSEVAQVSTPIEQALAEALRAMNDNMMRR